MRQSAWFTVALMLVASCVGPWVADGAWAQAGACAGDCNHDERVTIDELVSGVNVALGTLPIDRCPAVDVDGDEQVTVAELIAVVSASLTGCDHTNHPPVASEVSFGADASTPYVQKQLIGSDPDNDTITYELVADEAGTGYEFAYVNPESGMLYLTLSPNFEGTIVLPYRVTDGKQFSNTANATLDVQAGMPVYKSGLQEVAPQEYASFPRGFYNGALLGAPGADPGLPSSVDLSDDYPLPGNQGDQNSCIAWALGYAIKSYQERVEHGWSLEPAEHRFSPAYIYNQLNNGVDNGIIFTRGLDFIVNEGVASLALMPYDDQDFLTQPSFAARQEAPRYRAKQWRAANGLLEIKAALANRLAVFMVIQLMDDIYGLRGPDSVYNTFGGAFHIAHGVAAVGYDDNRYGGAFKIMNSWGQDFGDGGYFWMPYWAMNYVVDADLGPTNVLTGGVVLEDLPDQEDPGPDPVDPPRPADLPDLQVTNWTAHYDPRPGGSGSLQYTVTNTGMTTAPAGGYIALLLSRDPTFQSTNTLVVYEQIPFDLVPGGTIYRDENNAIAFYFPQDLEAGEYYLALSADVFDDVYESYENDNISPSTTLVEISNTQPDMEVQTWYANWDAAGNGALTYDVINSGASTAPAGWLVSLVLSPNEYIGDGDEIFLFAENSDYDIGPGGTLYRDESSAAGFSLVYDTAGQSVPAGDYYLALWVDPNRFLSEANTSNNASLSWGTVGIVSGLTGSAVTNQAETRSSPAGTSLATGEAYNGKVLPDRHAAVRKVRISETAQGNRAIEFLDKDPAAKSRPRLRMAKTHTWPKLARARQQVIFPVSERKPMPGGS